MKRHRIDRAHGHAIPGTPSSGVPDEGNTAGQSDPSSVVHLDAARAGREAARSASHANGNDEPLPVALAVEALRFPRDQGLAGALASDGRLAGRLVQLILMTLGAAVAIWVVAQLVKPGLGAAAPEQAQAGAVLSKTENPGSSDAER